MAFWNRNTHDLPGDLIGDDNSDEPRLTTAELESLYDRTDTRPALESWGPLLNDNRPAGSQRLGW